ncbi:NAD-dependent epimerase/dehydratase family protein [Nonomuraea sp. NPDC050451]|uniref:NAD-dependent epimerase/dehydratase family protein n=1 Tax=Nonomuraea sp. NPDC050451 TaxID=3364364 RepID=UPI0037889AE3
MHVFVAGATGAIGRYLVPRLIEAGHRVTGTSRTDSGLDRLRAQGAAAIRLDVFDAEAAARAVAEAAPDAIVHQLTALNGGTSADNGRIRRVGTRNLVDAAKRAGVRRIVAQSIAWAYEAGDAPATEDTPLDVTAPAPRSGVVGGVQALEEAVAELDEHVVLRYGLFYGPGTWYRPGGLVADVLRNGGPTDDPASVFLSGLAADDAVSSFVHVEDAAEATVAAMIWPSRTVNIVDDEPAPARQWLPALAAAVGAPAPAPTGGRAGWQRGADNGLARSLGWRPRHATWRTGFGS